MKISRFCSRIVCCTPVSYAAYSSTLKMEATCHSGTSVNFLQATRRCVTEVRAPQNHRCENLKFFCISCHGCSSGLEWLHTYRRTHGAVAGARKVHSAPRNAYRLYLSLFWKFVPNSFGCYGCVKTRIKPNLKWTLSDFLICSCRNNKCNE
jgi:hypothetical protein